MRPVINKFSSSMNVFNIKRNFYEEIKNGEKEKKAARLLQPFDLGKVTRRNSDFNYVVQRQEKTKVCFGSGLERKLLDFDKRGMVSKHARSNMKEMNEAVGPGSYDISMHTSAMSRVMNKPTSNLGTIIGGRKAERKIAFSPRILTPGPQYDIPSIFPKKFKQSYVPFNTAQERIKYRTSDIPGIGTYKIVSYKRRRAAFAHSFGGSKCLLPVVKMKCGPFNFDICERCKKYPEGDYWYLDTVEVESRPDIKKSKQNEFSGIFLCRECYDLEKKEHKIFSKGQMRNFKKIRDCSKVHFHDGCKAKLFLVSPQEIAKVKERECYLSLYFS